MHGLKALVEGNIWDGDSRLKTANVEISPSIQLSHCLGQCFNGKDLSFKGLAM